MDTPIDLRTDAIAQPTAEMWDAMRSADIGWAMAGEDPYVNELQDHVAARTGKDAALFVATGSMANLVAVMSHTERGDQIIAEASSHILWSEEWGFAYICGLVPRPIPGRLGFICPDELTAALTDRLFAHHAKTSLICLENTHNAAGGTIITPEQLTELARVARRHEVPIHVDGARICNACVALGVDLRTMSRDVDTLTINLNKGLSAPQGALLCGPAEFISRSRVNLKRLGAWSLSKAGIDAAAGLVALTTMLPQLAEDNRRADRLARGLSGVDGLQVNLRTVQTNIVMATAAGSIRSSAQLLAQLADRGILGYRCTHQTVRFVTHRHVTDDDVDRVISAAREISGSSR